MIKKITIKNREWEQFRNCAIRKGIDENSLLYSILLKICDRWNEIDIQDYKSCTTLQMVEILRESKPKVLNASFEINVFPESDVVLELDLQEEKKYNGIDLALRKILSDIIADNWKEEEWYKIPQSQYDKRISINNTTIVSQNACLHDAFFEKVKLYPDKIALYWYKDEILKTMSYKQLESMVLKMASMLLENGVKQGSTVAIELSRGIWQIITQLAVLTVGSNYVPISIDYPLERKRKICKIASIELIITDRKTGNYSITELEPSGYYHYSELQVKPEVNSCDRAYTIFTSGSTGEPKGVMINHKAAMNTILDVNDKFQINSNDCGLALSEITFDLSVYDTFGILAAGGSLVLLNEENKREVSAWDWLIRKCNVTVWNSVPALYEMYITCLEKQSDTSLKKILLSGDWITMKLFEKTKEISSDIKFISLGGATEAGIWSNYYEVEKIDPLWNSIPYGWPLSNQKLKVVDSLGLDCPDYVDGELWIGGTSVGLGYINDPELTSQKFITSDGIRWYKTGDRARYLENGAVEILGRIDTQVKVNGYRIELREIEKALENNEKIQKAIVINNNDGEKKELVAAIEPTANIEGSTEITRIVRQDNEDSEMALRNNTVKGFLVELCDEIESRNIILSDDMKLVYQQWKAWLDDNGDQYSDLMDEYDDNLWKILHSKRKLYISILCGEKRASEILQCKELCPEFLSISNNYVQQYIEKIVADIMSQNKNSKIAVLGAATGLLVEKLIVMGLKDYEITLVDASAGLLDVARERLADFSGNHAFLVAADGVVEEEFVSDYDVVIAINTLHQFQDHSDGIALTKTLLKSGGKLYAIEYSLLDAMGIVTSMVLEYGFKKNMKSGMLSPFIGASQWEELIRKNNFKSLFIETSMKNSIIYMEAVLDKGDWRCLKDNIRSDMAESIPNYMVPNRYIFFYTMPLNTNGKIDRNRIKAIIEKNTYNFQYQEELSETEEKLLNIWRNMLHKKNISRLHNFFRLGGDSLVATKLLVAIKKEFDIEISLKDVFSNSDAYKMAEFIEKKQNDESDMIEGEL